MTYNSEERIGVYSVAKIFSEQLKWIFREQQTNDFGIDAFVEITKSYFEKNTPTGKLFGVQIKSGKSFFREETKSAFVFRGLRKHLQYWLNYSIPVIIIIYDKDSELAFWQEVNHNNIILTNKSFKLEIPKENVLNNKCRENLCGIAYFKNLYEYKIWQLTNSKQEIPLLTKNNLYLYVEIDYIPNFSKYSIKMLLTDVCNADQQILYDYDNKNPNRFEYNFLLSEGCSLKEAIQDIIPWTHLYLNNKKFNDKLLTQIMFQEFMVLVQEEDKLELINLKKNNDFLKLSQFFADNYFFSLNLKANDLAISFLKLDFFLNIEPIARQRFYI